MILFVRYNLGPGEVVELHEAASVSELKEAVGCQHGVRPQELKVLFAGRELQSNATLQDCDVPEQSTIHVVISSSESSSSRFLLSEEHQMEEGGQGNWQSPDLSSSSHPHPSSTDLEGRRGREEEEKEETQGAAQRGVRACNTFYVYCKSCSSVQPGKLRVRCRRCKEATLKLSRGPSCWDDILLPGQIHGLCQSDGCQCNEAEFFMKCASHPTSDEDLSVALDLVMTNTRDVPCIACTDIMEVVVVFLCSQRHVICLDCFTRYCETRLNERQFVHDNVIGYSLPCAASCDNSLIKELHHFRVLGDEQYGRYLQYGAEECLLRIGGLMCPSPGCGAGLLPADGSRRVECDRRVGCGLIFCRECREPYHEGTCQTLRATPTVEASQGFVVGEDASLRGRWDQSSLLLIQESTKRCPQCSVPVEKNGGCMHMQCPLCRAEWCWSCGCPWSPQCMENHWFT